MALLRYNRNLVRSPGETTKYGRTHKGQANWAIGPHPAASARLFIDKRKDGRGLCVKFRQLMGTVGPRVPANAGSCEYFKAAP